MRLEFSDYCFAIQGIDVSVQVIVVVNISYGE